jgi:uncharacterized protein involved in outer membrane biogenesis
MTEPAATVPAPRRRIRWMRWGIGFAIAIVLFALIGFLVLPPVVKSQAEKALAAELGREVAIGDVAINPFTLRVTVTDFVVKDGANPKPLARFDRLELDAEWLTLLKRGIVVRAITLEKPEVSVIRGKDNRYNFSDIVDRFAKRAAEAPKPAEPAAPPRFSINNIRIVNGRVDVDDRLEDEQHALTELEIGIPFVSSFPADVKIDVEPRLAAKLNGDPLGLTGESTPFADDLDTTLKLKIDRFHFARYLDYAPVDLAVKLPGGELTAALELVFRRGTKGGADTLLLRGDAAIDGLDVQDRGGRPLVGWKTLAVQVKELDLVRMRGTLGAVTLTEPVVHARRDANGDIDLLGIVPPAKEPPAKPVTATAAPAKPFALDIERIAVERGRVEWLDESNRRPFKAVIAPLDVTVAGFNLPGTRPAEITVAATTDAGGTLEHKGTLTLAPLKAEGDLAVKAIRAKWVAPYYEHVVPVIVDDGTLDATLRYDVAANATTGVPDVVVSAVKAALEKVRVLELDGKTERAAIARMTVDVDKVDLARRNAVVGKVSASDSRLYVRRAKDGSINWAESAVGDAVRGAAAASTPPPPAPRAAAKPPAAKSAAAKPAAAPAGTTPDPDWTWSVKTIEYRNAAIRFQDFATPAPVTLELSPTTLVLENLASAVSTASRIALKTTLDRTGNIAVSGPITLAPLGGALALDVQGVSIPAFQAYFADLVNIVVSSGTVATRGNLGFAQAPGGPIVGGFQGDVTVAGLETTDKTSGERLLGWKSLLLSQLRVGTESQVVDIGDIALTDFFARVIVTPSGRLNLQDLVAKKDEPAAAPADAQQPAASGSAAPASGPAPDIRFSRITLQNGNVNFSDFFIKPNYSANLTNITGGVSEITPEKAGDVLIRGRVDASAPLEIAGQLNPLAKDLFLDIKGEARDIDLPPLTPYAAKYAGYGIEKGKLAFKVDYRIKDRKLEANNSVILDQLTFGERIETPTATKLPVLLAVALLKDRNGVIDLDLPISGTLDDPEFSVGGLIWKAIVNILTKAVVAPFSLIASAFSGGGSEELSFVEFEPGSATVAGKAEEKLKTLTKALVDRPNLKLDVAGRADPEADRVALEKERIAGVVRAQKVADLARRGTPAAKPEETTVSAEEYPKLLEAAWRQIAKPPRGAKVPAPAEMEAAIIGANRIDEEELRQLANRRSQNAKDVLTAAGVAGERVFITAPKLSAEGMKGPGPATRADFSLK